MRTMNYIEQEAIKIVFKENTTFDLYFSDGTVKRYDIISFADTHSEFNQLKDRRLFLNGKLLGWSIVVWNEELDIDINVIYYEGIDVTNEYDDVDVVVLGFKIKQKRLELELLQEELAELVGIDQSDLSKLEKGNANPTVKMVSRVAKGLGAKVKIDIE